MSTILRDWFIPEDGIRRDIISAEIQHYLGNDATVRPGEHVIDGKKVKGYWIRAYRNLTSSMIHDLKYSSNKFEKELRKSGRRVEYHESRTHRDTNTPSHDAHQTPSRVETTRHQSSSVLYDAQQDEMDLEPESSRSGAFRNDQTHEARLQQRSRYEDAGTSSMNPPNPGYTGQSSPYHDVDHPPERPRPRHASRTEHPSFDHDMSDRNSPAEGYRYSQNESFGASDTQHQSGRPDQFYRPSVSGHPGNREETGYTRTLGVGDSQRSQAGVDDDTRFHFSPVGGNPRLQNPAGQIPRPTPGHQEPVRYTYSAPPAQVPTGRIPSHFMPQSQVPQVPYPAAQLPQAHYASDARQLQSTPAPLQFPGQPMSPQTVIPVNYPQPPQMLYDQYGRAFPAPTQAAPHTPQALQPQLAPPHQQHQYQQHPHQQYHYEQQQREQPPPPQPQPRPPQQQQQQQQQQPQPTKKHSEQEMHRSSRSEGGKHPNSSRKRGAAEESGRHRHR